MNFAPLTDYLDSLEGRYGVPALDLKITYNHQTVYRHMCGYADYERQIPLNEQHLFYLYSMTKLITMTAVLQLIEQGRLGFYDELRKYLPEFGIMRVADNFVINGFPFDWPAADAPCHLAHNPIRIIDLMTMTAGFSYDTKALAIRQAAEQSGGRAGTREMVRAMADMPLIYEPQARWGYSLAHDVLGAVIETVSGMTLGEYLSLNLFAPLKTSDFFFRDGPVKERLAAQYAIDMATGAMAAAGLSNSFQLTEAYESGGAGLIGTTDAYSAFLEALCNGGRAADGTRILSEQSVMRLSYGYLTGVMRADFQESGKVGYNYGLGVRVMSDPQAAKSPLGEFGWDGAAGAYSLVDPFHRLSICYTQHVLGMRIAYDVIHPAIRDLAYEALEL